MQTLIAFIQTMRLHQWIKNLLVFAPLIFSKSLGDPLRVGKALLAFGAFCLLSSCVYVINDLLDADRDRMHPVKRNRPIAAGRLRAGPALVGAVGLVTSALLLTWAVRAGPGFPLLLMSYFVLNLAYSFSLKKVVVADVMIIAFGFLLRVAAGGLAIGVEVSHWIVLCTFFGATMLACCKRRAELVEAGENHRARAVLADYTLTLLDIYIAVSATASVMAYALYTVSERTFLEYHTSALIYTVPVVMYGISRYLFLVYGRRAGEDPAAALVRDPSMITAILLWLGIALGILYYAA